MLVSTFLSFEESSWANSKAGFSQEESLLLFCSVRYLPFHGLFPGIKGVLRKQWLSNTGVRQNPLGPWLSLLRNQNLPGEPRPCPLGAQILIQVREPLAPRATSQSEARATRCRILPSSSSPSPASAHLCGAVHPVPYTPAR